MSIENFLNDFDEQNKRIKEAKEKKQYEEAEKQMNNEQYLSDFQEYYEQQIISELKEIQKKLAAKFEMEIPAEPISAQRAYFYKIKLIPNFEHYVEKVEVEIIAEGERRLITLSGRAFGPEEKNIDYDGLHRFQDSLEKYKGLDLENEVTEILNKIFLRKKPIAQHSI